ncbi:MAG TPA: hypothetical protein VJR29_13585 [bacterium]|nr:hypothetical protein [bacterium]
MVQRVDDARRAQAENQAHRYERNAENCSPPARPSAASADSARRNQENADNESRRVQQALIRRIAQFPLMQERPASAHSVASRNETQTLLQLQRALGTQQQPAGVPARVLVAAGFVSRPSVTRIYTAKKSGTRAEGMAVSKKTAKAAHSEKSAPVKSSESAAPASPGRSLPRLNIPRPAQAAVRGAGILVSPQGASVLQPAKGKLLTSGVAIFLSRPIANGSHGGVKSSAPVLGFGFGLSPLFSQRATMLSPRAQAYILQLAIPAKLRIFFRGLAPTSPWEKAMGNIGRVLMAMFRRARRSSGGSSNRPRVDREFLNKMFRLTARLRRQAKLNKKRVRRVSSNIARAVGKTKTKDLKDFY